jgi:hypothetical protein
VGRGQCGGRQRGQEAGRLGGDGLAEAPAAGGAGEGEALLPHRSSLEDAADTAGAESDTAAPAGMDCGRTGIQEERRLCYVGITRAQQSLTFTRARRRRRFGETVTCEPSRFLAELPAAELDQPDSTKRTDAETRAHGSAQLAALKGLFGER